MSAIRTKKPASWWLISFEGMVSGEVGGHEKNENRAENDGHYGPVDETGDEPNPESAVLCATGERRLSAWNGRR